MERKHTLIDNAAEKRYELDLGDGMALAEYVLGHGLIVLTHTEVPPKYEGRGIGKELVQGVLEDIRRKKLKVVPQCPFVATYIRRRPCQSFSTSSSGAAASDATSGKRSVKRR